MMEQPFDLDFRPSTYWPGEWATGLTQTTSSWERWAKTGGQPEDMPNVTVPPALRYGGSDLPRFQGEEVEIARIELDSTLGDVTSLRAKRTKRGILYRLVDEYGTRFKLPRRQASHIPLTMRELVDLLANAQADEGLDFGKGFPDWYRDSYFVRSDGSENREHWVEPEVLVNFIRVSSFYYPELRSYYEVHSQNWLRRTKTWLRERGYSDEEEE